MAEKNTEWHLDRKVTLVLIFSMLMNAGGLVWWGAKLDAAVNNHELRIASNTAAIAQNTAQNGEIKTSLARIQEGQKYQTEMLKELKTEFKESVNRD